MNSENEIVIRFACSTDKRALFAQLVEQFNRLSLETPDGKKMVVQCEAALLEPDLNSLLERQVDAVAPESTLWLRLVESRQADPGRDVFMEPETLFAVSPIVIAMWEEVARSFGYPRESIGWSNIASRVREDREFKWGHPSISCTTGQLALIAIASGAVPEERVLSENDLRSGLVIEELAGVQQTVSYYGSTELDLLERARKEGRRFLDAFVIQEHLAIQFRRTSERRLVTVLPREGVIWADHPIALIAKPDRAEEQEKVFRQFCAYLFSLDAQVLLLSHGFHPVSAEVLDYVGSERQRIESGLPESAKLSKVPLVRVPVESYQFFAHASALFVRSKRHTNVFLVVDVSGSMNGDKLQRVQEALKTFVEHIPSRDERVGLVEFSSEVMLKVDLDVLGNNRSALTHAIMNLQATSQTALIDAIYFAYVRLQKRGDEDRLNAVVVLTDGLENASSMDVGSLTDAIQKGNEHGTPVVVYCIAYGSDADFVGLERIASASLGKVYQGSMVDITSVYDTLSRLF